MEGFEKRHTLPPEPISVSPSKAKDDKKKDKVRASKIQDLYLYILLCVLM